MILREIPDGTETDEVEGLFKSPQCPSIVSVEFASNQTWYVTFATEDDALEAYQYLRTEVKTFKVRIIAREKISLNVRNKTIFHSYLTRFFSKQDSATF